MNPDEDHPAFVQIVTKAEESMGPREDAFETLLAEWPHLLQAWPFNGDEKEWRDRGPNPPPLRWEPVPEGTCPIPPVGWEGPVRIRARVQFGGRWRDGTWIWSRADDYDRRLIGSRGQPLPGLRDGLKEDARRARQFGEEHRITLLVQPSFPATESLVRRLGTVVGWIVDADAVQVSIKNDSGMFQTLHDLRPAENALVDY